MSRYLTYIAIAALLMVGGRGHALGLGEAQVRSHFGSPLDLSIPVQHLSGMTGDDLRIALSALNDAVSGSPLDAMVGSKYEVDYDPATQSIRLRSNEPVLEPYLAFTLKVRWPSGHLSREYTVLLDMPAIHTTKPAQHVAKVNQAVGKPVVGSGAVAADVSSVKAVPVRAEPRMPPEQAAADYDSGRYRVVRGDSLWKLAQDISDQRQGSHAQWMAALFQENPGAFISGRPDRLKEAYFLTVPEACSDTRLLLTADGGYRLVAGEHQKVAGRAENDAAAAPALEKGSESVVDTKSSLVAELGASEVSAGEQLLVEASLPVEPVPSMDEGAPELSVSPVAERDAIESQVVLNEQRVAELERQLVEALALIEQQSQLVAGQQLSLENLPVTASVPPVLADLTTPAYLFRSMGWLALGMSLVLGYIMYRDRSGPSFRVGGRRNRQADFASMLRKN